MTRAVIGLGSNLGDRLDLMRSAIAGLRSLGTVTAVSSLYETAPVGDPDQGAYYNAIVLLDTDLPAEGLMLELLGIETVHRRERRKKWAARTLDLDLILYGEDTITSDTLEVPHPRAMERRFVLEPLVELLPDLTFPDGTTARDALGEVLDQHVHREAKGRWWRQGFTERGGWWVVGQAVGLGAWVAAAAMDPYAYGNTFTNGLGLLAVSLGLMLGFLAMRGLGRRLTPYPEPVGSSTLVQTGAYALARHPIYGGVLLLAGGASLLVGSRLAIVATIVLGTFFWVKAGREEERLIRRFHEYPAYRDRVKWRLVPWVL